MRIIQLRTCSCHDLYSEGLKKSLYNYMHGVCLDYDLQEWFDHAVPKTSLPKDLIHNFLQKPNISAPKPTQKIVWLGGPAKYIKEKPASNITTKQTEHIINCPYSEGHWLNQIIRKASPSPSSAIPTYADLERNYEEVGLSDFILFWHGAILSEIRAVRLVVI